MPDQSPDLAPQPHIPAAAAATILTTLRRETAKQHHQLDHDPSLAQLLRPGVALAEYRDVLTAFYGFYAPLEAVLAEGDAWRDLGIDRAARRKTPLLLTDLAWGGCADVAALPRCTALPPCASPSHAAGILYVLEGSTLGGRMIARHLHAALGLTPQTGLAFFSSYGDQVDQMWTETRQALLRAADRYGDDAAIVAGAQATFACLSAWFAMRRGAVTA